ncbi:hypothetical protein H0H92_014853 [Tricholoma furcatifolium]|nr:hypothetical protein H0H92_014853 [Tricholoma furcatifolium]
MQGSDAEGEEIDDSESSATDDSKSTANEATHDANKVDDRAQPPPAPKIKPLFSQIFNPIGMTVKENLMGVELTSPLLPMDAVKPGANQMGQKDRAKRRRTNKSPVRNVSSFLDLEAEVSGDDESDIDEDNLADFINDDDTDNASDKSDVEEGDNDPSTISHRELAHMMSIQAWQSDLEKEKKRDNSSTYSDVEHEDLEEQDVDPVDPTYSIHDCPDPIMDVAPVDLIPDSLLPLLPRGELEAHLWRVSVRVEQRGKEETVPFTLYRKAIAGSFKVASIVGRVSCPGWIYIEAPALEDVQELIQDVSDIHHNQIFAVTQKDHTSVLRETPFSYPAPGSWVRITERGLYHGDLAWVAHRVRGMQYDLVVPRVDLYPQKKRKRGRKGEQKKKEKQRRIPATRIPQQRLDASFLDALGFEITRQSVMPHIVERPTHWAAAQAHVPPILAPFHDEENRPTPTEFLFRGHPYSDGYAVLSTTHHKPAIPTRAELEMFKDSVAIPPSVFLEMEERLDALRLQVDDPVKITGGEVVGAIGRVVDLRLDNSESTHRTSTAVVETVDGVHVEVAFVNVRKVLAVGDCVLVVDGVHEGFTGWIVGIEGANVHLFDDTTCEGVCVAGHQVVFYDPPKTKYTQMHPDTSQAPPDFHFSKLKAYDIPPTPSVSLPDLREQNPHQRFVGRHVLIIKGRFKDYIGRVKNTERGDLVNVELQATLQQRQFNLQDLAHLYDPQLRPLVEFATMPGPLPYFAPVLSIDEPTGLSSHPLVPSTPIPEDSSASMGRAWNPSSRTPNPASSYPCNPYMISPSMSNTLRVHVVIAGTRPVLQDRGWKGGDFEGTRGLWSKPDNEAPGYALLRTGANVMERVPERYIVPVTPSMKGQRAIVIDSTDQERFCKEYYVVQYLELTKECVVRPAGTVNRKIRFKLPASVLAVVS